MHVFSLSKFRANASALLDLVERGESIRILRRGKPVADLVPVLPHPQNEATNTLPSWKRSFDPIKLPPGVTLSQAVLDERQNDFM